MKLMISILLKKINELLKNLENCEHIDMRTLEKALALHYKLSKYESDTFIADLLNSTLNNVSEQEMAVLMAKALSKFYPELQKLESAVINKLALKDSFDPKVLKLIENILFNYPDEEYYKIKDITVVDEQVLVLDKYDYRLKGSYDEVTYMPNEAELSKILDKITSGGKTFLIEKMSNDVPLYDYDKEETVGLLNTVNSLLSNNNIDQQIINGCLGYAYLKSDNGQRLYFSTDIMEAYRKSADLKMISTSVESGISLYNINASNSNWTAEKQEDCKKIIFSR